MNSETFADFFLVHTKRSRRKKKWLTGNKNLNTVKNEKIIQKQLKVQNIL